ncbi:hypothetical protein SK066_09405 [Paenibacillus hunanensis]|uniref:hypothetical protein n=1 Tax=Paenibacillus hunanensis TaxID=539262 RepID=UPI002A6AAA48|nr:hypothetical protein [Paenibacillus hunanensis]WPP43130.1 hypothetical protein SK066_09405 [Paenibacillus hunanensis]
MANGLKVIQIVELYDTIKQQAASSKQQAASSKQQAASSKQQAATDDAFCVIENFKVQYMDGSIA